MNTKTVVAKIKYSDKITTYKDYSNIEFLECNKDKGSSFWFLIILFSEIQLNILFNNFKKYLLNFELYNIACTYKKAGSFSSTTYRDRIIEYINEYKKY